MSHFSHVIVLRHAECTDSVMDIARKWVYYSTSAERNVLNEGDVSGAACFPGSMSPETGRPGYSGRPRCGGEDVDVNVA